MQLAQQRVCCGAEVERWSQSQHGCAKKEVPARIRANVFVRDMDLAELNRLDNRRIEIVADGLHLFRGVQLATDTTMVSPLHRDGMARRGTAQQNGKALEEARRRTERTYPELAGEGGRARLVVLVR